jgi:hypothetical protein
LILNLGRIYLRRLCVLERRVFFDLRVFFALRLAVAPLRLPPLNTVTGGTTTPVCGSNENLSTISTVSLVYLLRVAFLPLRVAFFDFRTFLVLRLPPFNGIVVGHPMPPGKLHQT